MRAITLFASGGVSEIEKEAEQPRIEIQVALIGPISSYFLALGFGSIRLFSRESMPVVGAMAGWLSIVNLALGTFNLLPGLPLDGGRVLRGVIWRLTGDQMRATQISSRGTSLIQMKMQRALAGVSAAQAMTRDCLYVPASLSLKESVDRILLFSGRSCFVVGEPETPRGIITLSNIRAVPREEWPHTSLQRAMQPWDQVYYENFDGNRRIASSDDHDADRRQTSEPKQRS